MLYKNKCDIAPVMEVGYMRRLTMIGARYLSIWLLAT